MSTSSPKCYPRADSSSNPYAKTPKDEASWLVGAARDAMQRTEELGDDPETLIQIILQAHTLLGVAIEKLQTPS